jgi:hypothetical protein
VNFGGNKGKIKIREKGAYTYLNFIEIFVLDILELVLSF